MIMDKNTDGSGGFRLYIIATFTGALIFSNG
jgi:hypothetical protein